MTLKYQYHLGVLYALITSSIKIVGRGIKKLILAINKIEGLGLIKSKIPLPRIISRQELTS